MRRLLAIACLIAGGYLATVEAQSAGPGGAESDWLQVGGDPGGSRYSPLAQIDRQNVWRLESAWTWRHGESGAVPGQRATAGFQATPILLPDVAGGNLVLCTPGNRLVALDPVTGQERWSFDPKVRLAQGPGRLQCLGVTYWQDTAAPAGQPCAHRILAGTGDRRLLTVDATSGEPCPGFGTNGQVHVDPLLAGTTPATPDASNVEFLAPPVVVNGVLVVGHVTNPKNRTASTRRGALHGFDARTGEFRWSFNAMPGNQYGANATGLLSVDPQRDLVFISTSGGTQPGSDPYANAVVALRGRTGAVAWSFQTVHHDVWGWDAPAQPLLVDIPKEGHRVPAVVVVTPQSLVFVLDRATGQPLFPVEERPVPTDGVVGEVISKTQPFPVRPPPLLKTRLTPDDAWGLTFRDENRCRELIAGARHGNLYTPPGNQGWIMFPGPGDGMDSHSGAWDPGRNLLITSLSRVGVYLELAPSGGMAGTRRVIERRLLAGPTTLPCTGPPWSTLVGVDLAVGEIRWTVPLGSINRLASIPVPPLKWGTPLAGAPIVTAGGLVFIGATSDARLRAFDSDTGAELWSTPLPAPAHASPMTYRRDGRQFIVIAAGGHGDLNAQAIDDYLVAYALPGKYLDSIR